MDAKDLIVHRRNESDTGFELREVNVEAGKALVFDENRDPAMQAVAAAGLTDAASQAALAKPSASDTETVGVTYGANDLTFTKGQVVTWYGFLDDALLTADNVWRNCYAGTNSTPTNQDGLENIIADSGVFTVNEGEGAPGSLIVSSYSSASWGFNLTPGAIIMPFWGIEVELKTLYAAGTASTVECGMAVPPRNTSLVYLVARYNKLTDQVSLVRRLGASESTLATVSIGAQPYKIGFAIADKVCSAWIQLTSSAPWEPCAQANLDPTVMDLRVATYLATFQPFVGGYWEGGSSPQTTTLGRIRTGHLHGIGMANMLWCRDTDGTPWRDGDEAFFTANRTHLGGASGGNFYQIPSSSFSVFAMNVNTGAIRTVAMLAFKRGTRIFGDNAGYYGFDRPTSRFIVLAPNWGDYADPAFAGLDIYSWQLRRPLFGAVVLESGTVLDLPSATSFYDPDLRRNEAGLLEVVVTETNNRTVFSDSGALVATCATLDGEFALVGRYDNASYSIEGTVFSKVGGEWSIFASNYSTNANWVCLDPATVTLRSTGAFTWTQFGTATHINILPVPTPTGTRYLDVGHNTSRFANAYLVGTTWSHGQARFSLSVQENTGDEFAPRRLPWV